MSKCNHLQQKIAIVDHFLAIHNFTRPFRVAAPVPLNLSLVDVFPVIYSQCRVENRLKPRRRETAEERVRSAAAASAYRLLHTVPHTPVCHISVFLHFSQNIFLIMMVKLENESGNPGGSNCQMVKSSSTNVPPHLANFPHFSLACKVPWSGTGLEVIGRQLPSCFFSVKM